MVELSQVVVRDSRRRVDSPPLSDRPNTESSTLVLLDWGSSYTRLPFIGRGQNENRLPEHGKGDVGRAAALLVRTSPLTCPGHSYLIGKTGLVPRFAPCL